MTITDLKPYIRQGMDAIAARMATRPILFWTWHLLEGAILQALDDGTVDHVVDRAKIDLTEARREE